MLAKLLHKQNTTSIDRVIKSTSYCIATLHISPIKRHYSPAQYRKKQNISHTNPTSLAKNRSLFWTKRTASSSATKTPKPSTDSELLTHNKERSEDHRQEIIENEYPDLKQVSHPYSVDNEPDHDHFYVDRGRPKFEDYVLPHPIWTKKDLESVQITHKKPTRIPDYLAYISVSLLRFTWDMSTGYLLGRKLRLFNFSHRMWLLRVVFLETVAGVPGMMFGMVRHLNSLRRLERDRGWIKSLLSEAENERIHLLTAMHLYKPSKPMRYAIVIAQGIMCNFLFISYLFSQRYCHSFVGYLEEQAVHTYTNLLMDIDNGKYPEFEQPASNLSKAYWKLSEDATWRDVFANIRADEGRHRDLHQQIKKTFSSHSIMDSSKHINSQLNKIFTQYNGSWTSFIELIIKNKHEIDAKKQTNEQELGTSFDLLHNERD